MKKKVNIIDSTLRDGEQSPSVMFTENQKIKIAEDLSQIGVDEIEAGMPAIGQQERKIIQKITKMNLHCDISVWCRAIEKDIQLASECNVGKVHISFPISDILLKAMGKNIKWVYDSLKKLISFAKKYFDYISIGAIDVIRCDKNILFDFINCAEAYGAKRVRLADTVGAATPLSIYHLILEIKKRKNLIKIGFHGHNDLGMATANSIAAIEAGADSVDVTINGIGERCGNAALEEVAVALKFLDLHYCNVDISSITSLCENVAKIIKQPIPKNKPVTGDAIFTHESGIHCNGILKNPLTCQLFLPETIGRPSYRIVAGKYSGTAAIKKVFDDLGICLTSEQSHLLVKQIKKKAVKKRKNLSNLELKALYTSYYQ